MIAVQLTENQLIVAGLASGIGFVGGVLKLMWSAPERESEAYQRGIADESARREEKEDEMRAELQQLRVGLLRVALAADLTPKARAEIAQTLGYPHIDSTVIEKELPDK